MKKVLSDIDKCYEIYKPILMFKINIQIGKPRFKYNVYDSIILGQDHCWYCGDDLTNSRFRKTKDHFWPKVLGGRMKVVCCKNCNMEKKSMTPVGYITYLEGKLLAFKHNGMGMLIKVYERKIRATKTLWDKCKNSIKV